MFAGGPFYCSGGVVTTALTICMKEPGLIVDLTLRTLYAGFEVAGEIDNLKNIERSKVFLFGGKLDHVINQGVVKHAENIYRHYGASVKTEYSLDAEHAVITDKYGTGCHEFVSPYINNCGYDGAFEAISHIMD